MIEQNPTPVSNNRWFKRLKSLWYVPICSFLLFSKSHSLGDETPLCCDESPRWWVRGNMVTLAPEYYYVKRTRKGGTSQTGNAGGIRLSYDYIKRYNFYLGGQFFYGRGTLTGRSGNGAKIKSELTDKQIEGYIGYTFEYKYFPNFSLTPFVGGGYFTETNNFKHPSPLQVKMRMHSRYAAFGFLSSAMLTPYLSAGLNLRIRGLWEARNKIIGDEDFDTINQYVEDKFHYRVELPFVYCCAFLCDHVYLGLMPFYEFRHYGGKENYPFDFFDTKYKIYGADFQVIFQF